MHQLLLEQGMNESDILEYFTGLAFLAWHRMGTPKRFDGPLPLSYLTHLERLNRKFVRRAPE